jgi:hypothetical protein
MTGLARDSSISIEEVKRHSEKKTPAGTVNLYGYLKETDTG